ncbi:hypothetical protein M8J76_000803 [Diaphorina citri]|nr:hypothetical protein M8J76_000803 [Diaphorina citri]
MDAEHNKDMTTQKNICQEMTDLYYAMDSMNRGGTARDIEIITRKEAGTYQKLMTMPDVIRGDYSTDLSPPLESNPQPSDPNARQQECEQPVPSPNESPAHPTRGVEPYNPRTVRLEPILVVLTRQLRLVERKLLILEQKVEKTGRIDFTKTVTFLSVTCIGIFVTKAFL